MSHPTTRAFKVAMVAACPFPANHGSPASIREMSEALARLGHDVHIVTHPNGQRIPVTGVRIHRAAGFGLHNPVRVGPFWQRPIFDFLLLVKLLRVIRNERIEIIHAHNYEGALIGYAAKLLTGRPLLYNAVNIMSDELPSYRFIRPKALAKWIGRWLDHLVPLTADSITVVSEELRDFMARRGIPSRRVVLVPAGIHPEMFEDADPDWIRRHYPVGSRPIVLYTGTLDEFQRVDYLLKAMQQAAAREPQALLAIYPNIVNPVVLEKYREMAAGLGMAENIIWMKDGHLQDLPHCLASADIAVLPRPACPGHPVKLLNYMAAGKAIVAFKGSAKGLRHLYNGFLVEDHDWQRLGEGILTLLKEPELAKRLGVNAKACIQGNFDWSTLANGISVIYHRMMAVDDREEGSTDDRELYRYLRKSYHPVFLERRRRSVPPSFPDRRKSNRRIQAKQISFLERRKMTYE
ncbi:MAG: glycosyltransferase family 4 protein [Nitrospirae bacterium]|nr:glycosyltransferase family 4 protein [Nitrospirota bacterium]